MKFLDEAKIYLQSGAGGNGCTSFRREKFVEYGGPSGTIGTGFSTATVLTPSGILMPIFSVRKVVTQVTIFDGATVIIGGLTREEVKTVNDKIPVLGNLPLIGRFFQSSAESYLIIPKIIDALKSSKADAIHPGYGFLSENSNFAKILYFAKKSNWRR